ncbi:MAG: alanine racemase [Hyphomicrobium sp.]
MKKEFPISFSSTSSAVLCVNLDTIGENWKSLSQFVHPAECAAVVKADAYGLGMQQVIPRLYEVGCKSFFIATPNEAKEARSLCSKGKIYVLDGLFSSAAETLYQIDAIPCLSSFEEVNEWSTYAACKEKKLKSCLHIDSGLSRLGLNPQEMQRLLENTTILNNLDIELVMSHLASADDPLDPTNEIQLKNFKNFRKLFPKAKASLAASDGLMLGKEFHYDLVRPGYALYGGQASKEGQSPVKPVVSIYARILQIKEIPEGTSVGYSSSWKAYRKSRIAVVALGYADGIPRSLSSTNSLKGGSVKIHGSICPIVGRVSMDLITVDVTDCTDDIERGEFAEIIYLNKSLEEFGSEAGTIGYEILTRLGKRYDRIYYGMITQ